MSKKMLIIADNSLLSIAVIKFFISKDYMINVAYSVSEPNVKINGEFYFIDLFISKDKSALEDIIQDSSSIIDLSFLNDLSIKVQVHTELINDILATTNSNSKYLLIHGNYHSYSEGYNEAVSSVIKGLNRPIQSLYVPFIYLDNDSIVTFIGSLTSLYFTPTFKYGEAIFHPIHFVDFVNALHALISAEIGDQPYFLKGQKKHTVRYLMSQVSIKDNKINPFFFNVSGKVMNIIKGLFLDKQKIFFNIFSPKENFVGEDLLDYVDLQILTIDSRIKKQLI
jgi:hypothetical protein